MAYQRKDSYYRRAKSENYAARSVYKLQEMDRQFRLFRKGVRVLDLGCAPGSWTQYALEKSGSQGHVVGIDLQKVNFGHPRLTFIHGSIFDSDLMEHGPFDLVLSDMAPKTTGIKFTDQMRSLALCEQALDQAKKVLRPGGHFVCKLFHSGEFQTFRKNVQTHFQKVRISKPKSTRKESKEIFIVGLSFIEPTDHKTRPLERPDFLGSDRLPDKLGKEQPLHN